MIFVFGSINVDLVQQTNRLPLPGETVLCDSYSIVAGGKGANQALAAARSGASVTMIGKVGADSFAALALQDLKAAGVDLTNVSQSDRPTGCATIHVADDGENAILVSSGANQTVSADQIRHLQPNADDTLILQMEVPLTENWVALNHMRRTVGRVILNAAPAADIPDSALESVDILVVNEGEGVAIVAQSERTDDAQNPPNLRDIPALLAHRHNLICILTLGADGAIVASPDGGFTCGAPTITPIDTTGAGDTFVGVLASALDAGMPLPDSVARASLAAGLTCTTLGAQPSIPTQKSIAANQDRLPKISILS